MDKGSQFTAVRALEDKLGVSFQDQSLALSALTHKSYCNEHRDEVQGHNERLEFLGDAVIGLVVSQRLMARFPQATEGELSKMRAMIVNEDGLASVARSIDLGKILLLGRGEEMTGGRDKDSLLADALEAVIGALYLSQGLPAAAAFVETEFAGLFSQASAGRAGLDYKTELQEEAQVTLRIPPRYRVISERGPEHEKIFEVEVMLGQDALGRASGRSKKDAEQAAAREALRLLRERRERK
jgi:ribonuclease-3